MTPTTLRTAGEALYGPRWQSQLARDLGVADRTMRRWATGASAVPDGARDEIASLLARRLGEIEAAQAAI